MKRTFQTRLSISDHQATLFDDFARLAGKVERKLYAQTIAQGIRPESVKNAYLVRFGITGRQFNAICRRLKGKVDSIRALRKDHISNTKQKIKKTDAAIKKLSTQLGQKRRKNARQTPEKIRFSLHHKKRRLAFLKFKLTKLQSEQKSRKVNLCFGSKKLFNAQHHLEDNGFKDHEAWLTAWQDYRNDDFYALGSKDEASGCQSCVMAIDDHENLSLKLRLPNALVQNNEKSLHFPITLSYGKNAIESALQSNTAISYLFKRDNKGWRVFITVDAPVIEIQTSKHVGAIGVDINADHLAVAETDRFGNVIEAISVPLNTYGKNKAQSQAIIGDAIKQVMIFSKDKHKPLVVEKLDFSKKKATLGADPDHHQKRYARMLSSLAYNQILKTIQSRAYDAGIEVIEINPAYTSIIGFWKFATRYGLSSHQAAALVIARRGLDFSERPNRRDYNATQLPARKAGVHMWSYWSGVARKPRKLVVLHALRKQSSVGLSPPS